MLNRRKLMVILFGILLILGACNLPQAEEPSDLVTTAAAATLTALRIDQPLGPSATPVVALTETSAAFPTATPQNPLVLRDTLCWVGPGPLYEVVSALKKDTRVLLLGRASIGNWWIVENPIYHDPCWVMAADLQIDPGTDLLSLKIFNPPPSPTPTWTPSPTLTPTPTP